MPQIIEVCPVDDLKPGERRLVEWEDLEIPVGLAFFLHSSDAAAVPGDSGEPQEKLAVQPVAAVS